jgi:hypothetical protein
VLPDLFCFLPNGGGDEVVGGWRLPDQCGTGSLQPSSRAFSLQKHVGFEHEQPVKGYILKAEVNAKTLLRNRTAEGGRQEAKPQGDREMARKRPGV